MRKLLSEDLQRAAAAPESIDAEDLARWAAWALGMESRIAVARSILEDFEPDDTYGAMIKMSAIDALDGES